VGRTFLPHPALGAVALGTLGSAIAGWVVAGRGLPGAAVAAATLAGRLLLDVLLWLVAAALLGAAEGAGGEAAGGAGEGWAGPVAVAAAQRLYLAPAAAAGRLVGAGWAIRIVRPALWIWMLALLWLVARERGHDGAGAARIMALGLLLPAALLVAGVVLAGLGWMLAPLFPGGFTPFVPI